MPERAAATYEVPRGARAVGRYGLLVVVSVVILFPIYTTVLAAVKPGNKVLVHPLRPDGFTLDVLREAWTDGRLGRFMLNSLVVALISRLASFQLRQTVPQLHQSALRIAHFLQPSGSHMEISLRPSTAFRRGFAKFRVNEAFVFQPCERRVDAADEYLASSRRLECAGDRHAVRVGTGAEDRQQHHQLEVAERLAAHMFNFIEQKPHVRKSGLFAGVIDI